MAGKHRLRARARQVRSVSRSAAVCGVALLATSWASAAENAPPVGANPPPVHATGADGGTTPTVAPPPIVGTPGTSGPLVAPPPVGAPVDGPGAPSAPASFLGGVPAVALAAYRNAATMLATENPGCHLPVVLLAGIGKVESGHARGGQVDAAGDARPPIFGPVLDGSNGTAAIPDTDHGALDGDPVWDRAVGPMQFIPSTWARWASDGNNDGIADPQNLFDASLAAGRYLCADGRDLATQQGLQSAILSYNDSSAYLRLVWSWMLAYQNGGLVLVGDSSAGTSAAPAPGAPVSASSPTSPSPAQPAPPSSTPPPSSGSASPPPTSTPPSPTPSPSPVAPPLPIPVLAPIDGTVNGVLCTVTGLLGGLLGSTPTSSPCPSTTTPAAP